MSDILVSAPQTHENPKFREFIQSILSKANLGNKYIESFTDKDSMIEFTRAFTHKSIDSIENYEFYEILGDATTNKIVVWYYMKRFPDLFQKAKGLGGNMGPVAIMARLKMNGISKRTYSKFSDSLGFWEYIRRSEDFEKDKTKILEDVFESFCGCLENLIDKKVAEHSGYCIIYKLMKQLMDPVEIVIDRDKLYDSKTRLNEIILSFKGRLGVEYVSTEDKLVKESNDPTAYQRRYQVHILITDKSNGKVYSSAKFYGSSKQEASQKSAEYVISSKMTDKLK